MAANDETPTLATLTSDAESKSKDKEEIANTSAETKSPATTSPNGDKSATSTPKRRVAVQKVASGGVQNSYLTRRRQHQIDHANRPCFTPNVEAENCLFELLNSSPIGQPVGLMRHHNLAVILNDLGEAVKKKAAAGNTALAAGLDAIFPKPSGTAPDHRPALCSKWNALYNMDALNCRRAVTDFPDAEARKASSPWTPYSARSKAAQFTSKDLKLMNKSGSCSSSTNSSGSNSSKQNNSSSNSNSSRGKKVNTKFVSFSLPPTMPSENEEIPLETVQSVLAVSYSQLSKKLKKVKLPETLMQQVNTAKEKVAALATEVATTTSATVTVKKGKKSGTKNAAAAVVAGDQEKGEKGDKKSEKKKKKVAKIMEKTEAKVVVKEEKMNDDDKEVIPSKPTVPEAAQGRKAQIEKVAPKAPGAGGKVFGRCSQGGKVCARGALRRITRNSTTGAISRQTRGGRGGRGGRDGRGCGPFPITGTRRKSLTRPAKNTTQKKTPVRKSKSVANKRLAGLVVKKEDKIEKTTSTATNDKQSPAMSNRLAGTPARAGSRGRRGGRGGGRIGRGGKVKVVDALKK